jgi:acyl-CoA synthetase (AMP-forming)/AMP-acid ligase II
VIACEPLPENVERLRANVAANRLSNVQCIQSAIAARDGTVGFANGATSLEGRVADDSPQTVSSRSVDSLVSAGAPLPPDVARDFGRRFGCRLHGFYGSSETGGIAYDRTGQATLAYVTSLAPM